MIVVHERAIWRSRRDGEASVENRSVARLLEHGKKRERHTEKCHGIDEDPSLGAAAKELARKPESGKKTRELKKTGACLKRLERHRMPSTAAGDGPRRFVVASDCGRDGFAEARGERQLLESYESKGCCEPMPPRGPIGATEIKTGQKKQASEQKECGSESGRGAGRHRAERPRGNDDEKKKGEAKRPVAGAL